VNFGGSQKGPGLNDREESHIAAIWPTRDRSKMRLYDGPPNSQNLTGCSIDARNRNWLYASNYCV